MVKFRVFGEPVPQGSKRAFVNKKTGAAIITDANNKTKPWRQQVAGAAAAHSEDLLLEGPIYVHLSFYLRRPKSVKRPFPSVKPDIDKLNRAVLDALSGVVFVDDSQVIGIESLKFYATEAVGPGVFVEVWKHGQMEAMEAR